MNIFVSVIISRNRRPAAACAPLMTRLPLGGKTRGGCPDFPPDFPPEFPPDFGPTFLNRNFRVQTHPILPTPPDFRFQIRVVPPEFGRSEQIRVENRVENRVGDPIIGWKIGWVTRFSTRFSTRICNKNPVLGLLSNARVVSKANWAEIYGFKYGAFVHEKNYFRKYFRKYIRK